MLPSARGESAGSHKKLMVPHTVSHKVLKPTTIKSTVESDNEEDNDGTNPSFFSLHDNNDFLASKKFETSFIGPSWAKVKVEQEQPDPEPDREVGPYIPSQTERQTTVSNINQAQVAQICV